jgi:hypothetical protein
MKYIKISGNLIDVMGDKARHMNDAGVVIYPQHQMNISTNIVSYGVVSDEEKAAYLLANPTVTVFESVEAVNVDIDITYVEKYSLADVTALQLDLQLSGNPEIPGYDSAKSISTQENLKALFDAGMGGIQKERKSEYFAE